MAVAETKTEPKKTAPVPDAKADLAKGSADAPAAAAKPAGDGPPMLLRALIGFSGLSLLVGFFLDWVRIPERPAATEGGDPIAAHMASGLELLTEGSIGGLPAAILLVVPILAVLLSAAAFMGFRWAGQVAIGISSALLLLGLWVVLQLFVQHTDLGLWITVGGTFITLLLGVISLMWAQRRAKPAKTATPPAAPASAPKAA